MNVANKFRWKRLTGVGIFRVNRIENVFGNRSHASRSCASWAYFILLLGKRAQHPLFSQSFTWSLFWEEVWSKTLRL